MPCSFHFDWVHFSGSVRFGSKFTGIRVFSVPVSGIKTTIWVINMENWFHDQDRVNPKGQTWETPRKHMTHHLGPCTSHFCFFWKKMCRNRGFGSNGSTYSIAPRVPLSVPGIRFRGMSHGAPKMPGIGETLISTQAYFLPRLSENCARVFGSCRVA